MSLINNTLMPGDIFTKEGWMNITRPKELQQFLVEKDGARCTPIYTKEDLVIIKQMNKEKHNG